MHEPLRFIASMPRLQKDGAAWVSELRRVEAMGFDTVAVSQHVTNGWQLAPLAAMAFAAATTSRLRVMSLVVQNGFHHPALLAKDIATIDVLSNGRVELGIGPSWKAEDYTALGLTLESGRVRLARLAEAVEIIRRYFTTEFVDFVGNHYRIDHMEALPKCVQRPNPPILIGAGSPRMLDLAGRTADIVGIHARMNGDASDQAAAVTDLTSASITAKIERIRAAAAEAGAQRPASNSAATTSTSRMHSKAPANARRGPPMSRPKWTR